MDRMDLDKKLFDTCKESDPNLDEIKKLIIAGANTNQSDKYGESIFNDLFLGLLCDNRDDKRKTAVIVDKIKEIIQLMIDNGWNVKKYGLDTMDGFVFSTYDHFTFDLYKFMLQYDLTDSPKDYEKALDRVGAEESFQGCEHCHELENLFYSIYEMIEAKMEGRDFKSIELYYDAVGITIDRIVYFSKSDTLVHKDTFTEYNEDIGFVCGNKLLVLRDCVNILFMNNRLKEQPQIDISSVYGKDVIGQQIKSIDFDYKDIIKGTTYYGQPTIIIALANGKKLKFTHNFGEQLDEKTQARFWIE